MNKKLGFAIAFLLALTVPIVSTTVVAAPGGLAEAQALLATAAKESGRPSYSEKTAVKFKPSDHECVKSSLDSCICG